jgi:hypothetical protein
MAWTFEPAGRGRCRMSIRGPRYSKEEFARRGQEIYDRVVRPALRPEDDFKFVAIDIETSEYEMDPDDYTASKRLRDRLPDSQTWMMQVGQPAAHRLGARSAPGWTG